MQNKHIAEMHVHLCKPYIKLVSSSASYVHSDCIPCLTTVINGNKGINNEKKTIAHRCF